MLEEVGGGHDYVRPRPWCIGNFIEVEPRGFELLTSAVQRRRFGFIAVHRGSKTPANSEIA